MVGKVGEIAAIVSNPSSKKSKLILRIKDVDGRKYLDLRKFISPKMIREEYLDQDLIATSKGIMLSIETWPNVIESVRATLETLR